MPRWELVTGWVLRVGILATAIAHAALGDWAAAAICVLALALAVTPTIIARTTSFAWPFEVELVGLYTMLDLIADGIGGIIAAIVGPLFMHRSRRSRARVAQFAERVDPRTASYH
ncbi:MAG TPA: hypothetical protein VLT45_00935 [Kofleriaceae bacterium]|nr:hypothetical protein [Kofleriaceae bacterium]